MTAFQTITSLFEIQRSMLDIILNFNARHPRLRVAACAIAKAKAA